MLPILFLRCSSIHIIRLIVLFFILMVCSCNPFKDRNDTGPKDFDNILRQADLQAVTRRKPDYLLLKRLDSAFYKIDNPTIEEQCRRYFFKNTYFFHPDLPPTHYLDSIILLVEQNGLENSLAETYSNALLSKGDTLIKMNDFTGGFRCFYTALENIKTVKDTCLMGQLNLRIADVEYRQGNYLKAANYNKQAFADLAQCNVSKFSTFSYQQATLDNIGLNYDKNGMADSALHYFNQALDFIGKNQYRFPNRKQFMEMARGIIYGNMGTAYVKMGNKTQAEMYLKKSIEINKKKDYANVDAQLTRIKLAQLYIGTSHLIEAKALLQEIKTSVGLEIPTVRVKVYKLEADYLSALDRQHLANEYLNAYINLNDTIAQANKKLEQADLRKTFRNMEQQELITTLVKNGQAKTFYLSIAAILVLLLVLIALLIWYNRRRLARMNAKINAQNKDMQTALEALQQSQEENMRIMEIVAHDLRTPMSITISIVDIMLEKKDLTPSNREMLEMMRTANHNSLEMIVDLLNINTPKQGLKKEPVEMHILLRQCIDLLNIKVSSKEQQITLDAQQIILMVNRDKIWRVISNLIINASKFSPIGAVIKVKLYKDGNSIFISVQDHGIGIPEELKNRIFNIFTDARRLGTSGEISFGLGLSICKQIIEAHNGKISFTSEVNKGTTFLIELPL